MRFAAICLAMTTVEAARLMSMQLQENDDTLAQTEAEDMYDFVQLFDGSDESDNKLAQVDCEQVAPINVIDNSRGGGGGCGCGGGGGGDCFTHLPVNGFANLGMDSEFLNPILKQRLDLLDRQIAAVRKS